VRVGVLSTMRPSAQPLRLSWQRNRKRQTLHVRCCSFGRADSATPAGAVIYVSRYGKRLDHLAQSRITGAAHETQRPVNRREAGQDNRGGIIAILPRFPARRISDQNVRADGQRDAEIEKIPRVPPHREPVLGPSSSTHPADSSTELCLQQVHIFHAAEVPPA